MLIDQRGHRHHKMRITWEDIERIHVLYRAGVPVMEIAEQLYERYGYRSPEQLAKRIRARFNSLGFEMPERLTARYTDTQIKERARQARRKVGRFPTTHDWRALDARPSVARIYKRYGSWAAFRAAVEGSQ